MRGKSRPDASRGPVLQSATALLPPLSHVLPRAVEYDGSFVAMRFAPWRRSRHSCFLLVLRRDQRSHSLTARLSANCTTISLLCQFNARHHTSIPVDYLTLAAIDLLD